MLLSSSGAKPDVRVRSIRPSTASVGRESAVLSDRLGSHRADILAAMKARGVGTSVYYPVPLPLSAYYREKYGYRESAFPNAAKISHHSMALPVGPHLSEDAMLMIAESLKAAIVEVT